MEKEQVCLRSRDAKKDIQVPVSHSIFDNLVVPRSPCDLCDSILPRWEAFRHRGHNGWTPRSDASFASPLARKRTSGKQSRLAATED